MEDNFYFWKWKMTSILFEHAVKSNAIFYHSLKEHSQTWCSSGGEENNTSPVVETRKEHN
jgi:hypothetical protein